jgi:sec-independent protein translocase protein TatA
MNLGGPEMLLILIVVLLLFGGKRLPELARSIGKGMAEFRRAAQSVQHDLNSPMVESPPKPIHSPNLQEPSPEEQPKTIVHAHPAAQPRSPQEPPGPNP